MESLISVQDSDNKFYLINLSQIAYWTWEPSKINQFGVLCIYTAGKKPGYADLVLSGEAALKVWNHLTSDTITTHKLVIL
ncbi:MAG: hypothetical protein QNJ47_28200 [Nostocaceae cyanobacterium]|nr:hypothetical protein [Nostocaceae cyanobacterium]